jgi:hypothetical protein
MDRMAEASELELRTEILVLEMRQPSRDYASGRRRYLAALEELKTLHAPAHQASRVSRFSSLTGWDERMVLLLWTVGGAAAAYLMTIPIDLRRLRLVQMVLLPCSLVAVHFLVVPAAKPDRIEAADIADFLLFLPFIGIMACLLAPNIASGCAYLVQSIIDPHRWEPQEGEIDTSPIRRLIREGRHAEALKELSQQLGRSRGSYEAFLLQAKLLYHFGRKGAARDILLRALRYSETGLQQEVIMQALREI